MKKLRIWGGFCSKSHSQWELTDSKTPLLTLYVDLEDAQQMGETNIRTDEPDQDGGRRKDVLNEASGEHFSSPAESLLL